MTPTSTLGSTRAAATPGAPGPAHAATHGAGAAIGRFSIAHHITGSAAWVAALASARAEGVSIRTLAAAVRLSSSRVHQIVAAADLDELDAALGELRAAGWPAPEDPDGDDDAELDGRELIADRLSDEVGWLRQCTGWLRQLDGGGYRRRSTCARPPTGRTGPSWPSTWRGWPQSSTGSPPTWTSSPEPGGSRT
ncbi:MAG TPA: hypothetical protein VK280_02180 [Streptosporangiaceae bacterium]|nr:hypothetical protein [Streptosporangiaceae bacterium]